MWKSCIMKTELGALSSVTSVLSSHFVDRVSTWGFKISVWSSNLDIEWFTYSLTLDLHTLVHW